MKDTFRILILEDRAADAELMMRELRAEGISFTAARVWTASDFVSEVRNRVPDVILAAYTLPAYDGLSALHVAEQESPEIPFIFVSGSLGEETAIDALHHGATDYVLKDRLARLGPAVRRALCQREDHRRREDAERGRRATEAEIRRVSREWEEIFQAIGHPTVIMDADNGLLAVNHAVLKATGKTAEELLGSKCYRVFHGDGVAGPAPGCPMERARASGRLETSEIESLGGTYGVSCTPILDEAGRLQKIIHIATDITEHKRAEQALRQSEEQFRMIFDHVTDGTLLVDPDTGVFAMANRTMCTMLGCTEDELVQLGVRDIHEGADLPAIEAAFRQDKAGQSVVVHDLAMSRKDGTIFFADVKCAPVNVLGRRLVMMNVRDVTERRALQASVAQSDRLASMGMLAAGVAHEINNPLSYVLYDVESLARELPKLAGSSDRLNDLSRTASEALAGVQRIKDIVRGLGTFSRVDKTEQHTVDLAYVIDCAASMAQHEIKYRAQLVKILEPVPAVWASEGQLCQVFLNLLINAAHAIAEGYPERNSITVRTSAADGCVVVEVIDTGTGIPAENLKRVFEPFFTTKPAGVGSGLGLTISLNIVRSYGGDIRVESKLGTGTRFIVRLPVVADGSRDRPGAGELDTQTLPAVRGRILVVDDEEPIRLMLLRMLSGQHEVVTAASGREGQVIIENDRSFDLILCDLMMPDMTGMDLHAWLANQDPALATQVVFLTGGAFTPRANEYLARVSNLRFEKPFDTAGLPRIVMECIREHQHNRRPAGLEEQ